MQSRLAEYIRMRCAGSRRWMRAPRLIGLALFLAALPLFASPASRAAEKLGSEGGGGFNPRIRPTESTLALAAEGRFSPISHEILSFSAATSAAQSENPNPVPAVPETPQPQLPVRAKAAVVEPCHIKQDGKAVLAAAAAAAMAADPGNPVLDHSLKLAPCPHLEPLINWYARFLSGSKVKPMTPKEKAWLAVRNVGDPFNAVTILGLSGIAVASNAHSPYGPGMTGFGRYVGVSYTEDMTGEFFGTFVIPSIVHQDPHYHRLPDATIKRRIAHAIYQVVWTQGDNGKGMLNYAGLGSGAIGDALGNLYVPGQKTDLPSTAERYGIGVATAPIDNFVTEFIPDVARRIHLRVVLFQQIINQVAKTGGS